LWAKRGSFAGYMMLSRNVGIIGASGWLGSHLSKALCQKGWNVTGFSRSDRGDGEIKWRQWSGHGPVDLDGLEAVINLAGEAIDQRWTAARKVAFRKSRVDLTQDLVKAISDSEVKVLLNGSATGFYGDRGDECLSESKPVGEGYLADLCRDWEKATEGAEALRVCHLRTGVVLGKGGRAWEKIHRIFKLGIGGKLGNGRQWLPWVHLDDEINAIIHCLENDLSGPVNLVAPVSVTNADFTKAVGRVLRRPTLLPAPGFMLKLVLGDFAKEGLLASTRAIPEELSQSGFRFTHPEIGSALEDCL
jgi:uncharacterized protein